MVERKYKNTPRKKVLEDRNITAVGLVALAVLVGLMATLVMITKIGPGYKKVSADFVQAAALLPKNPVVVAGIPVGTVTGMRLNGDRVTVDMKVQNNLQLGKDTRATIMVTTILGSRYLSLAPGGLTPALVETLESAGPFGIGWPGPRVAVGPVRLVKCDLVGTDHLRMIAAGADGRSFKAIAFRAAQSEMGQVLLHGSRGRQFWLAGRAKIDDWGSRPAAELHVEDAAFAD